MGVDVRGHIKAARRRAKLRLLNGQKQEETPMTYEERLAKAALRCKVTRVEGGDHAYVLSVEPDPAKGGDALHKGFHAGGVCAP